MYMNLICLTLLLKVIRLVAFYLLVTINKSNLVISYSSLLLQTTVVDDTTSLQKISINNFTQSLFLVRQLWSHM